jgi:hypothetical protein
MSVSAVASALSERPIAEISEKNKSNALLGLGTNDYALASKTSSRRPVRLRKDIGISDTQIIVDGIPLDIETLIPIPIPDSLAGSPVKSDTEGERKPTRESTPKIEIKNISKKTELKREKKEECEREESKEVKREKKEINNIGKKEEGEREEIKEIKREKNENKEETKRNKETPLKKLSPESSGDSPLNVLSAEGSPNTRATPERKEKVRVKASIIDQRNSERIFNSDSESNKTPKSQVVKNTQEITEDEELQQTNDSDEAKKESEVDLGKKEFTLAKSRKPETPQKQKTPTPKSSRLEDEELIQQLQKRKTPLKGADSYTYVDEKPKRTPPKSQKSSLKGEGVREGFKEPKSSLKETKLSNQIKNEAREVVRERIIVKKVPTPTPTPTPKSALKTPTPSFERLTPKTKKVSIGRAQTPIPSPGNSATESDRRIVKKGIEIIKQEPDSDEDLLLVPVMIDRNIIRNSSIGLNTPEHKKTQPIRLYSNRSIGDRETPLARKSGSRRTTPISVAVTKKYIETPIDTDRSETEDEGIKPTTMFVPTRVKESNIPFAPIIPFITLTRESKNTESNGAAPKAELNQSIDIEVRKIKLKDKFTDLIRDHPARRIDPFDKMRPIELEEARFSTEEALAKVESKVKEWQVWILLAGLAEEVFGIKVLKQNTSKFSKINVDLMSLYESSLKEIAMSDSSGGIFDGIPPLIKIPLISIMLFMGLIFVRWVESKLPEGVGEPLENTAIYLLHNNAKGDEKVGPTRGINDIVHGFVKAFPVLSNFMPKAEGPKIVPVDAQPEFAD